MQCLPLLAWEDKTKANVRIRVILDCIKNSIESITYSDLCAAASNQSKVYLYHSQPTGARPYCWALMVADADNLLLWLGKGIEQNSD